jgi:hypothetical protein
MEKTRNTYIILATKLQEKNLLGRPTFNQESNVKMDFDD